MRPGSVLLMHQRTIHSSLENLTDDQVRISLDLRYQPIGQATGRPAFAPPDLSPAAAPIPNRWSAIPRSGRTIGSHCALDSPNRRTRHSIAGRPTPPSAPEPWAGSAWRDAVLMCEPLSNW